MKIIYFEGLFGVMFSWLKRAVIDKIEKDHPYIKIERRHWSNRDQIDDLNAIVIGHSFGAHAAWLNTHKCKLLVTYDPRWWVRNHYAMKLKEGIHHNAYQPNGLKGYWVDGAANHYYIEGSHLGIVKEQYILNIINSYLEEGK